MIAIQKPKINTGVFRFGGQVVKSATKVRWTPNSGPQMLAYKSKADILGYGGAAGGGKSDLALGLAATAHKQSVIFRRVFPNLRALIERSREIFNAEGDDRLKDSYNESLHRWQLADGRMVEFEACQYEKDKEKQRGRPRDLYVFDEATEFTKTQFEFIIAWLRSVDKEQRCRVLLTFNPPSNESGTWIIDFFLPWLSYLHPDKFSHPNPTPPGKLLWFATVDGEETICDSGEPFEHNGEAIKPMSRTFIPARLEDNPYLNDSNYRSVLQSMPEPFRSQLLYGDFGANSKDDPWQVIPTAWVRAAQIRWTEQGKPVNHPLSGVGVDVARGGKDALTICRRYGVWFDEIDKTPGVNVEDGPAAAGIMHKQLEHEPPIGYINIDVIGVGTSAYDSAKVIWPNIVNPVNAAAPSDYVVRSENNEVVLKMRNLRAEYHWRLREALDPKHGKALALPPGNEVLADLCAPRYQMMAGGVIQIEKKEDIKERIGRSPDVGEAIMLAHLHIDPNTGTPFAW